MPHAIQLLAGTVLSSVLAGAPLLAQTGGPTSPGKKVEGNAPAKGAGTGQARKPVETQPPNAPLQKPAFVEHARAPQPAERPKTTTSVVAEQLPLMWAMRFLPDGQLLATAKEGRLYVISQEGKVGNPVDGVPRVDSKGQGGLLDVVLAPDFESSNRIFFSFSEPREGGNGTSVATAILSLGEGANGTLKNVEVIFQQTPTYDGDKHYGSRLVFGTAGELFVTMGERSDAKVRTQAQDLGSGLGKVFRLDRSGKPLADNPFVDKRGAQPEIWSYGHRNVQSAALDADGRLWIVEHGPRGGDELNRPQAGLNYGWPDATYGVEYSGKPVGKGTTAKPGTEQPVYYWDPVIGPSGMALYEGDELPEWQGAFIVGGLVSTGLVVLHMRDDRVAFEERVPLNARVRDVRIGPDGAVYALTDDRDAGTSRVLRISRAK
jgi:glucose/arabinose dehydrogenase